MLIYVYFSVIKILETDTLIIVKEEQLKANGETDLYLVKHDKKVCHALLVHTGGNYKTISFIIPLFNTATVPCML